MLEIRTALPDDAGIITGHRRNMFLAMGRTDPEILAAMSQRFTPWVTERLSQGKYLGWFAVDQDRLVAGLGLLLLDWAPHYLDPAHAERAYLLNLYVEPAYRRQGLASRLIDTALAGVASPADSCHCAARLRGRQASLRRQGLSFDQRNVHHRLGLALDDHARRAVSLARGSSK
jgi:GNAT superfamily N-acetyltransferase